MPLVSSGVEHGNLRELALARMRDLGTQCRDVRTREVGIQEIHHKVKPYEVSTDCRYYNIMCNSEKTPLLTYDIVVRVAMRHRKIIGKNILSKSGDFARYLGVLSRLLPIFF